jgi:enamine deaminase RidA (YjgF/YER057c/UK114 family)
MQASNLAFIPTSNLPIFFRHPIAPSSFALSMVQTEEKLAAMGISLPPTSKAAANYIPCQRVGNLLYLSGHLPLKEDGSLTKGRIGPSDQTVAYGYAAARQAGLNILATLQAELGDLDRVEQIVKLFAIVQSADEFHEQHKVANGCSDLMVEVFGEERGLHARSAIGTNALPLDTSIEIEAIVKIKRPPGGIDP